MIRDVGEAPLSLSLFGKVVVHHNGQALEIANRKCKALLACLALSDSGEETRERLVGLLWSEHEEERARASLRQALYELRTLFESVDVAPLSATKITAVLDPASFKIDVWAVFAALKAGRVHPLLLEADRIADSLLEEFESIDPAFRVWLLAKRQTLHDRLVRNLEQALGDNQLAPSARSDIARALLNLDPTHEEATRASMRLRAETGDIAGALTIYKRLWDLLDEEYEVEPSRETQELAASLKLSQPLKRTKPEPIVLPPSAQRSFDLSTSASFDALGLEALKQKTPPKIVISMAAFNVSAVHNEAIHLVQGFRRELIACLVRFREWAVRDMGIAARAPVEHAKAAEYVIEADAFGAVDALRLVLTLRDVNSGEYLWSHHTKISINSWFEAQQVTVRHIATALNVNLSMQRLERVGQSMPADLDAYDLWLLGQSTFLSFDPANWNRAADLFRQVIERSPNFAPAYSSLAQLHNSNHIVLPGIFRDRDRTTRALQYAREAARLDPIDSRSQLCLGWSHAMSGQYDQAMIYAPLAYELNESDPWTKVSTANCLAFLGEYGKARDLAGEALNLPLAPSPLQWSYHSAIRFMDSDYEGCIAAADAAADVNPNVPAYKAASLHHLGQLKEARDEFKRFCGIVRDRWVGTAAATEEAITRWVLTMFPIKHAYDWERLRDGLAGAGAPVRGFVHQQI